MKKLIICLCLCFCSAFAFAALSLWGGGNTYGNYATFYTSFGKRDTTIFPTSIPTFMMYSTSTPTSTSQNTVSLTFSKNLVNAQILVYNSGGACMHYDWVTATAGTQYTIDARYWSSGNYTLVIRVGNGPDDMFTFQK